MTNVERIVDRVRACGYEFSFPPSGPTLVPVVPGAEMPADLMDELLTHRERVIEFLSVTCRVCGKDVSDPFFRARQDDPAFCDQGGARGCMDGHGTWWPEVPRCPYKRRR